MKKKFKLNSKVKAKWMKALRSGKYTQGNGKLKTCASHSHTGKTEYCCLGVARELGLGRKRSGDDFLTNSFLPDGLQENLADKNDSGRWSFKRIADWIEKNL